MFDKLNKLIVENIEKKEGISLSRVNQMLGLIKEKLGTCKILAVFVTNTADGYGSDIMDMPVQIDILTDKFLFELWFGMDAYKYDYTLIGLIGVPELTVKKSNVGIRFPIRGSSYARTAIVTYESKYFRDLCLFHDEIVSLFIKCSVD